MEKSNSSAKNSEYSNETNELLAIATKGIKYEIIPWTDKHVAGISILRNYPKIGLYKPVLFKDGKPDSVALIKVGYWLSKVKQGKVSLDITISNASRYKLDHYWYDPDNPESPDQNAINKSEESPQPVGLEELRRFTYYPSHISKKFYDEKNKKYVKFKYIVDEIYRQHLDTLTNKRFIFIKNTYALLIRIIEPLKNLLIAINLLFFGKSLKKGNTIEDYAKGSLSTYKQDDLLDVTQESDKIRILNSDIPISPQSGRTFLFLIGGLYLVDYKWGQDFTGIIALIDSIDNNNLLLIILTSILLIIIDKVIPKGILILINLLIKSRIKLYDQKIPIY